MMLGDNYLTGTGFKKTPTFILPPNYNARFAFEVSS